MMDNEIDDGFNKKRLALLDLLLDIQDKDPSFTDVDVREETDTFIFEGHDTTTSAISFCLYNISRNPEVQVSYSNKNISNIQYKQRNIMIIFILTELD